jgi:hypothetical protein
MMDDVRGMMEDFSFLEEERQGRRIGHTPH